MFYLRHFKNFDTAELDDQRPVTLLIGPNGAGKSNLIEAVELLSFLAAGRPLHEVTDLGREGGLEIRGGLDACASYGHETFTLGMRSNITTEDGEREAIYEISVRVGKEPRIVSESLRIQGCMRPVFEVGNSGFPASADNRIEYDDHNTRTRKKPVTWAAGERSALSQYSRFAWRNKKLPDTLKIIDEVLKALLAPAVFDPVPKLMRNYERDTENRLARNGFNISPVLLRASQRVKELVRDPTTDGWTIAKADRKPIGDRILRNIAQFPDEPFDSFDFIITKANDVMFGFKTPHSSEPVTARILSDGTLRALAILTALETSVAGQHLILEEFDNGVHPSRVAVLTEALFDCAWRNNLHVLATTQNPATMNALTKEQLSSVLLVVHQADVKSARLLPLKELPGYIEFVEQGRLGDLITRRIYEQHLGDDYEGQRHQDMESWLKALP